MESISQSQKEELSKLFSLVSTTSPGSSTPTLGPKELGFVLRALGLNSTESEIRDMISEVDSTGSGRMDEAEFGCLMCRSMPAEAEPYEEIQDAFDKMGDGEYVTVDDLLEAARGMGGEMQREEAREMVAEADVDGNGGRIGRSDWKYMLETKHKETA